MRHPDQNSQGAGGALRPAGAGAGGRRSGPGIPLLLGRRRRGLRYLQVRFLPGRQGPVFLLVPRYGEDRQLPPLQAGAGNQHGGGGPLAAQRGPRGLQGAGRAPGPGHVPDLPGPLCPGRKGGSDGQAAALYPPGGLGRPARLQAGPRHRGDPLQRLLRRQLPGHRVQAALSPQPGRGDPLPEPHLHGLLQPPLRHRGLQAARPHAGYGGGLPLPLRRRPPAGHAGDPGRGLFPHRGEFRLL